MSEGSTSLPPAQYAVQLVGPGELILNRHKKVVPPGPTQLVVKVEAVGLCFSDLKLLKQFTAHTRKSEIVSGISPDVLAEISSYVPGDTPAVPGHEAVCRIVAVGSDVRHHAVGERVLVQTDYRQLRTATSNAAFGYNFEGGLQEYVLMDERVVIDPTSGERFLIPVDEQLSASSVALVEPWACVEDSYVSPQRRAIKPNSRLLVVADAGAAVEGLTESLDPAAGPAQIVAVCAADNQAGAIAAIGPVTRASSIESADEAFDDIIYFGATAETIEALNSRLAAKGLINIVTAGRTIGRLVSVSVGRVHYGGTRWTGTTATTAAAAYDSVPETGEIRPGENISVVGAAGPMGQMHVIRNVCAGVEGVSVTATDLDDARLASLRDKVDPLAAANGVQVRTANPRTHPIDEKFSYFALMVPAEGMVADAVAHSSPECLINVFAGIPPTKHAELDMDTYIANRCYMFGTSGSVIRDMQIVLDKMKAGRLDTDCSVEAICGMAGAADGIAAVEHRTVAGKIIVYPALREVGMIPLSQLGRQFPTVADKLDNSQWCKAAEDELLLVAGS